MNARERFSGPTATILMPPAEGAEENGWNGCSCYSRGTDRSVTIMAHCPPPSSARLRWASTLSVAVAALVAAWCSRLTAAEPAYAQDERNYSVFDALFLQRNNAAINRPLVVSGSSSTSVPVITAGDPTSTIGTGARLLYGNYGEDDIGWEVGYLGVYGMNAASTASSAGGTLEAPQPTFATQSGLNSGFSARVSDTASINSAEVNLVFHEYDGGYNRRSGQPWQRCDGYDGGHVDWIGGFRWANLQDEAVLAIPQSGSPESSTYTVDATSNLFAAQVGTRGRMAFERWAVEGWMKIGIAGTMLSQSQTIFDPLPQTPFRPSASSDKAGMGMIADMNLSAIYRFNDVWGLRVGYNLIWLTGVALAPDQFDFSSSRTGGTNLNGSGSMFLSGANLGLEARW